MDTVMDTQEEHRLAHYITEHGRVPGKYLKHYLYWINLFIQFSKEWANPIDSISSFTKVLGTKYSPFNISQARKAVTLYLNFLEQSPEAHVKRNPPKSWIDAERRLRNELVLQHKSYRTEKTYLYWFNDFQKYVTENKIQVITDQALRGFLTYLAVERQISFSTQKQAFNALLFFFRHVPAILILYHRQ